MQSIKNNYPKFHSNVKEFTLDEIPIIGNFRSTTIIGLDDVGVNLISKIKNETADLNNLTPKEQELFDALKSNGFFDSNDVPFALSSLYLHVTDHCNLHCVGCYSYIDNRNKNNDLTLEQIKTIVKNLKDLHLQYLVISGGEPFLRDDLPEILKFIRETLDLTEFSIISNGTMPFEKYDKCLPYLDKIAISVDGYSNDTRFIRDPGIMPKVFETIEYLKNKIPVSLIATLHRKTSPFINNFVEMSKSIDVPLNFSILTLDYSNPLFKDYILRDDDYENMNNFLKERSHEGISIQDSKIGNTTLYATKRCGVGKDCISISADGSIYPCQMLHVPELKMGNALTDDIKELLTSEQNPYRDFDVDKFEECAECEYRYVCGGGCRASSYYKHHDILHPEAACKHTKEHFKNIVSEIKAKIALLPKNQE